MFHVLVQAFKPDRTVGWKDVGVEEDDKTPFSTLALALGVWQPGPLNEGDFYFLTVEKEGEGHGKKTM